MKKSIAAAVSFLIAVAMGVAIVVMSAEEPISYIQVVKTKNEIMQHTTVLEDNLEYVIIPLENSTPEMVKDIEQVKNNIAVTYIGSDSFLYKYQVDKEINILGLREGQVPLRLETNLISFGGARPGDYVDIITVRELGTQEDEEGNKMPIVEAEILLSNIRVINHVFGSGATKTLVHNQLYGESQVIEISPENVTVPPMEVSSMEVPAAVDLAVTLEQAKLLDEEVAKGNNIQLRINPWYNLNGASGGEGTNDQQTPPASNVSPPPTTQTETDNASENIDNVSEEDTVDDSTGDESSDPDGAFQ